MRPIVMMLCCAALGTPGCGGTTAPDDSSTDSTGDSDTDVDTGFVTVPASTFDMGCTSGESDCCDDEPIHTVTLSHDYLVSAIEVTQSQFKTRMTYNPASFADCGDTCPVERVKWAEAAAYANALSDAEGYGDCYSCTGTGPEAVCALAGDPYACDGYRLLTEAEWEGAARCGQDQLYAGSNAASDVAWTMENAADMPHAVAGLRKNRCGLYDMSGNVLEWTGDAYSTLTPDPATDPAFDAVGSYRVVRGGAWSMEATDARVSNRGADNPDFSTNAVGFRLARSMP